LESRHGSGGEDAAAVGERPRGEAERGGGRDGTESCGVWEEGEFVVREPEARVSCSDFDPPSTQPVEESAVITAGSQRGASVISPPISGGDEADRGGGGGGGADGWRNKGKGRGLEVYAEPPEDMMAFLRGMTWWEEGMIQKAERSGRATDGSR